MSFSAQGTLYLCPDEGRSFFLGEDWDLVMKAAEFVSFL